MNTTLISSLQSEKSSNCVLCFHDCVQTIDWGTILRNAERRIDILVYYWSSWIDTWSEDLKIFLSKPKTKLRVVLADPSHPLVLNEIKTLFPEYSEEELVAKIEDTYRKFNQITEATPSLKDSVELYALPRIISYSCQRVDDDVVIYSIFEMYRRGKVDAPCVMANLQESSHLRDFFDKEWEGIFKDAVLIQR